MITAGAASCGGYWRDLGGLSCSIAGEEEEDGGSRFGEFLDFENRVWDGFEEDDDSGFWRRVRD